MTRSPCKEGAAANTGTGINMPSIVDEDLDYLDETNALSPADLEAY